MPPKKASTPEQPPPDPTKRPPRGFQSTLNCISSTVYHLVVCNRS